MGHFSSSINQQYPSAGGHVKPQTHSEILLHQRAGWELGLPADVKLNDRYPPAIISVGSGKGGVGKSILCANLATKLASKGYRVLLIDLDLGCANLHTHFGISVPQKSLVDFVLRRSCRFSDAILQTSVPNLGIIAGGQDADWSKVIGQSEFALLPLWDQILSSRQNFGVDFVILDLGAGTGQHTMDFFAGAHLGILTALPEPTSLENAYVFLKTHIWNTVEHLGRRNHQEEVASDIQVAFKAVGQARLQDGYAESMRKLLASYPEFMGQLSLALRSRSVGIVMNQTRSQAEMDVGLSMELICQRYFNLQAYFLGAMNYDDSAWKSLRNRRLLLSDFPHSMIAKCINRIANASLDRLGYLTK